MSWSVNFIGAPDKVVAALENYSTQVSGKAKEEYDAALPHLTGIVSQNISKAPICIRIDASGHGYDGYNQCSVNIQNIGNIAL